MFLYLSFIYTCISLCKHKRGCAHLFLCCPSLRQMESNSPSPRRHVEPTLYMPSCFSWENEYFVFFLTTQMLHNIAIKTPDPGPYWSLFFSSFCSTTSAFRLKALLFLLHLEKSFATLNAFLSLVLIGVLRRVRLQTSRPSPALPWLRRKEPEAIRTWFL